MEACVVIYRMKKPKERRNKVLFINAVSEVTRERALSFLTDDHLQRIVAAYQVFANEEGFARVVGNDEIREKGCNLSIQLYVRADNGDGNGAAETISLNIARAVARLSCSPEIDPDYLMVLLRSRTYQQKLLDGSFETARKTLNLNALGELKIAVPSLNEQSAFKESIINVGQRIQDIQDHLEKVVRMRANVSNSMIEGAADV